MSNQVSQVDAVIDALIAVFTTAELTVLDGSDDPSGDRPATWAAVIVGGDGDPLGVGRPAAVTSQTLGSMDQGSMDETGAVTCAVVSQSGDDDLAGRRADSLTLLGEVESALRNDSTLGGVVADGYVEGIQTYQARARGSFVRRVFTYRFTVYQDIP